MIGAIVLISIVTALICIVYKINRRKHAVNSQPIQMHPISQPVQGRNLKLINVIAPPPYEQAVGGNFKNAPIH